MSGHNTILADFTSRLTSLIEGEVLARTRQTILAAIDGGSPPKRRGRPPKTFVPVVVAAPIGRTSSKPRKKAPLQLCPVPGCKKPAAPIFGMVCAEHKDLPKAKIKAFREARQAKKLKAEGKPVSKKRGSKPGRKASGTAAVAVPAAA